MSYTDKFSERNAFNPLAGMFSGWMNPTRKQEAAGATEQPKGHHGIPNLSALFSEPVVKPVSKPVSKAELPKCVAGRITHITRCEGGACTRTKICE